MKKLTIYISIHSDDLNEKITKALAAIADGGFEDVPEDDYVTKLLELTMAESKASGNPMVKMVFKIIEDREYLNRQIYIYFSLFKKDGAVNSFGIKNCLKLLKQMKTKISFDWVSIAKLETDLIDAFEEINNTNPKEFLLNIKHTPNKDGGDPWKNYTIKEVYAV